MFTSSPGLPSVECCGSQASCTTSLLRSTGESTLGESFREPVCNHLATQIRALRGGTGRECGRRSAEQVSSAQSGNPRGTPTARRPHLPWRKPVAEIFKYVSHPHVEKRKAAGPPTVAAAVAQVHGPGPIGRLNAKIGLKVTVIVGTMWCAYLFTLLALISAPSAFKTGNSLIIIAWIAQTFLQLVLCGPDVIIGMAAGVVG